MSFVRPYYSSFYNFYLFKNKLLFYLLSLTLRMEFTITTADGVKIRIPKDLNNFLEQYPVSRYLECNHQRAREFKTTYGNDQSPEAEEFRQLAKDLLEKGKMVLDELGIVFWLSSGTCLGQCPIIRV